MKIAKLAVAAIGLATAAPAIAGCGPEDYEGM